MQSSYQILEIVPGHLWVVAQCQSPSFYLFTFHLSIQRVLLRFSRQNSMLMTQLDLNHDPYKNNFCPHTSRCSIGPEIATRLGISLILIKRETSRIHVLDLVLLQTLNSFKFTSLAAVSGFEDQFPLLEKGLKCFFQAGDTY